MTETQNSASPHELQAERDRYRMLWERVEAAYHHLRMEMLLEVMDAAGIEQVARPWSPAEEWKRVLNILRERNPMTTWCYTCEAEVPVPGPVHPDLSKYDLKGLFEELEGDGYGSHYNGMDQTLVADLTCCCGSGMRYYGFKKDRSYRAFAVCNQENAGVEF